MNIQFRCPPELTDILPRPYPAKRGHPEWLKRMAATAPSADVDGEIRTVKQCPPFVDAMGFGFIVPLVTDIHVDRGSFTWDWDLGPSTVGGYTRSPLSFHLSEQLAGAPIADPENNAIKFTNYWTIETPPGCALLVTHPFNREELPFHTLTGLVDTAFVERLGAAQAAALLAPGVDCGEYPCVALLVFAGDDAMDQKNADGIQTGDMHGWQYA